MLKVGNKAPDFTLPNQDNNSISLIIDKKYIVIGKTVLDITDDILKIVDEKIGKNVLD